MAGGRAPVGGGFPSGVRRFGVALAVGVLAVSVETAAGQALPEVSLSADNDGFAFWKPPAQRSDRFYTHGLRASWQSEGASRTLGPLMRLVWGEASEADPASTAWAVGHKIFTPTRVFAFDTWSQDRPYAGWLYMKGESRRHGSDGVRGLGIEVGVTGPPSLARQAHQSFHRWLDKAEPTGWEYQLPFELAFAVTASRSAVAEITPRDGLFTALVEPGGRLSVGTLRTSAGGGVGLSLGINAAPATRSLGPRSRGPYLVLRAGLEAELVIRDLFLDGATFGESHRVAHEPLLGRLIGGAEVGVGPLALEFDAVRTTREFRGQPADHSYGTIRLLIRP